MAKVRTHYDPVSPIGLVTGKYYTTITDKDGETVTARGTTREDSRQNAEDKYDEKVRGK